jgi:maleamate amidohydrolase
MAIWDDVIGPEERAAYERAGPRPLVGFGIMPALLIVDMYRAFVDPAYPYATPDAPTIVARLKVLLTAFRERGLPVFFTTAARQPTPASRGRWKVHGTVKSPLMDHPTAYEIWPELQPRPDEYVFVKTYPSGFFGTTLASHLIYHRVDTVVVTGTVTSGCVRGTCLDAFNLNYRVIVPQDCVCDRGSTSHKVALFEIHTKYGDVVDRDAVLDYLSHRVHEGGIQSRSATAVSPISDESRP